MDYYHSQAECDEAMRTYINSNSRYKNFFQHYFTAGDEEQFQSTRDQTNSTYFPNQTIEDFDFDIWEGYHNVSGECVTNTFRYIFNKFKKGIYIRIKDNKLVTFLPFSKVKFVNEWGDRIKIDPKYTSMIDFFKHINIMEGRPFNDRKINKFTSSWYANNCLVRYEYPISEGDTGTQHMKNMFDELCQNRIIPDIELFVNRRDFPMLKKDGTEPYDNVWDSDDYPLVSHKFDKYIPILSSVSKDGFADIPIPTIAVWSRIKSLEGAFFPKTSTRQYEGDFSRPWNERISTAVFRGGSTGCGVTIETNPRLKVSYLSKITKPDVDGIKLLNAGITDWNLRPRKIKGEEYLKTIEISTLPFDKVDKLTPEQQTQFKYIVHIDGHVSAFRLSLELNMGSVILIVNSNYKMWYKHLIKPYVHYIPVKADLSDLIDMIKWCKMNDDKCVEIVKNAKLFYKKYLSKDGVFNYLQSLLFNLKNRMGSYTYCESFLDRQLRIEKELYINKRSNLPLGKILMLNLERCYNRYKAISWMRFEKELKFKSEIMKTKLSTISEYEVQGIKFVLKMSQDTKRIKENIHETFIGINETNELLKQIPNFVYIFNSISLPDNSVGVIMEKIEGVSMMNWISSRYFNMKDYYLILKQISLSLQVAQKSCGFVHYDLFPWNIMIQILNEPKTYEYVISHDKVISIKTHIIPILIDYGKSHVIHKGNHYGFINMFKTSTVHDILTILMSSVNQIMKEKTLHRRDEFELITLINFISNTKFCKNTFISYRQVRTFLNENCSFSNLIYSDKHELDTKTPLDFYNYLVEKSLIFPDDTSQFRKIKFNSIASITYFNFMCSSKQIYKPMLLTTKDKICIYYYFQTLENNLYKKKFIDMLKDSYLRDVKISGDYPTFNISDEFHLTKDKVTSASLSHEDYSDFKEMLDFVLTYKGEFELTLEDRKQILEKYSKLSPSVYVRRYFADYNLIHDSITINE